MRTSRTGSLVAGAAGLALVAFSPQAGAVDLGVDLHAGTLGAGLGLGLGVSDNFNARLGFNRYTVSESFEEEDIDYETDFELETGYLLGDWHPFGGIFRVTGGVMANNNEFSGSAEVEAGDEVGDQEVPPGGGGRLGASITFDDTAPYLGIGWGRHAGRSGFSFSLDIGVLAQGSPIVDLREEEDIAGIDEQDVEDEEGEIEDALSDYDMYPVIAAGLAYRF